VAPKRCTDGGTHYSRFVPWGEGGVKKRVNERGGGNRNLASREIHSWATGMSFRKRVAGGGGGSRPVTQETVPRFIRTGGTKIQH